MCKGIKAVLQGICDILLTAVFLFVMLPTVFILNLGVILFDLLLHTISSAVLGVWPDNPDDEF
jgi:hypothetical protein